MNGISTQKQFLIFGVEAALPDNLYSLTISKKTEMITMKWKESKTLVT